MDIERGDLGNSLAVDPFEGVGGAPNNTWDGYLRELSVSSFMSLEIACKFSTVATIPCCCVAINRFKRCMVCLSWALVSGKSALTESSRLTIRSKLSAARGKSASI